MAYNNKNVQMPDFYPNQQQGWVDFEEDQPINIDPAVNAFQKRFMDKPSTAAPPSMHEAMHGGGEMPTHDLMPQGMNQGMMNPAKKAGGMKSL